MADPRATRVLVSMCVFIAVNQPGFGAIVPVVALYARSFGVGQAAIGVTIAVYGLARFLVAVPVGKLTDVLGRRAALALGGVVTAGGNLLCAHATDFSAFVAGRCPSSCTRSRRRRLGRRVARDPQDAPAPRERGGRDHPAMSSAPSRSAPSRTSPASTPRW